MRTPTGLKTQYTLRRDLFLDIISEEFDLSTSIGTSSMGAWSGCTVYTAYAKPKTSMFGTVMMSEKVQRTRLLSFVAPSSGMFVWVRPIYFPLLRMIY